MHCKKTNSTLTCIMLILMDPLCGFVEQRHPDSRICSVRNNACVACRAQVSCAGVFWWCQNHAGPSLYLPWRSRHHRHPPPCHHQRVSRAFFFFCFIRSLPFCLVALLVCMVSFRSVKQNSQGRTTLMRSRLWLFFSRPLSWNHSHVRESLNLFWNHLFFCTFFFFFTKYEHLCWLRVCVGVWVFCRCVCVFCRYVCMCESVCECVCGVYVGL